MTCKPRELSLSLSLESCLTFYPTYDWELAFHKYRERESSLVGIKEEYRDAFRFLFNINGREEHLRYTRFPFGAERSPFKSGVTIQHHLDQQSVELENTVQVLKDNTYVDNVMQTGTKEIQTGSERSSREFPLHK